MYDKLVITHQRNVSFNELFSGNWQAYAEQTLETTTTHTSEEVEHSQEPSAPRKEKKQQKPEPKEIFDEDDDLYDSLL
jgi:hypothetical protein